MLKHQYIVELLERERMVAQRHMQHYFSSSDGMLYMVFE